MKSPRRQRAASWPNWEVPEVDHTGQEQPGQPAQQGEAHHEVKACAPANTNDQLTGCKIHEVTYAASLPPGGSHQQHSTLRLRRPIPGRSRYGILVTRRSSIPPCPFTTDLVSKDCIRLVKHVSIWKPECPPATGFC